VDDVFSIKRHDRLPELKATLVDADGNPIPLTGASVKLHVRAAGAATVKLDKPCNIIDDVNGVVSYPWDAGETDDAGDYDAEFEITFSDDRVLTVPNDEDFTVRILEDIA